MDPKKRIMIMSEIEYWRRSKLLPEQYCDFLSNLYADEQSKTTLSEEQPTWIASIVGSSWKTVFYLLSIIAVISILLLNFNAFPLPLQIGVAAVIILLGYGYGLMNKQRKSMIAHSILGVASMLLLMAGPIILRQHGLDEPLWIGTVIAISSIVWITLGISFKVNWLHFCGWIGLMLVYAWSVYISLEDLSWIFIQLMWIPLAFLFFWIAWYLHRKHRALAKVFFSVGIVQWFIPDMASLYFFGTSGLIQAVFICKFVAGGLLLYWFRNLWTKWVTE